MRVISGSARGTILHSIEDIKTRPTLDRVKESLFNIVQNQITDAVILDLFAGSGAIGIEFLSRGANCAYMCDNSMQATKMIKQNLIKTKLEEKAKVINKDYLKCLQQFSMANIKFDIIYLDPPYKEELATKALDCINELQLLQPEGIIIIETDEEKYITKEIEKNKRLEFNIYDIRKYGRACLIFLKERRK